MRYPKFLTSYEFWLISLGCWIAAFFLDALIFPPSGLRIAKDGFFILMSMAFAWAKHEERKAKK